MLKNVLKIVFVFITGMAGGIFAEQAFWPYLPQRPFFSQYQSSENKFIKLPAKAEQKKEITIQENTALKDAVEKVEKVVVGVKAGKTISGSGIIITSDGLMVTLAELLPRGEDFAFFINGKTPKYQVLKRDLKNNLALVKIEGADFQTCGFADSEKLKLGERIFLVGTLFGKTGPFKSVNEGIVKSSTGDFIRTNIIENNALNGSPLFNIKGELLGLNMADSQGKVIAIPVAKIRAFVGL
jgi:S1-C subfamily serine protease